MLSRWYWVECRKADDVTEAETTFEQIKQNAVETKVEESSGSKK